MTATIHKLQSIALLECSECGAKADDPAIAGPRMFRPECELQKQLPRIR